MRSTLRNPVQWAILGMITLAFSCTEVVDIDLDSTYTRLVVEGAVTTDSVPHWVKLSTTADYFSNEPAPSVTGASVELEFGGNSLVMEENDTVPGLYQTPGAFRGNLGTVYSLHIGGVDVDGDGREETYHAESTIPGNARLDSVALAYSSTFFASGYEVYMYALDPPGRNWYSLKFWKNSDLLTDTLLKFNVQSDDFYDGSYLFYGIPIGFYNDEDPREVLEPGDTVTLEVNGIEEAYYHFVLDAQFEILGNNPLFSGPSANVPSNIDHDARGFFSASSVVRASVIVEGE
jgi:hypothetical protein